jgi:hypothetical protein
MDIVADLTLQPFLFVDIDRNRGVAAFGDAAAATRVAIREVSTVLNNVESSPIGPDNALTV